eukprot:TRINITY_DN117108_c0_g1_i1.p1 TRINITY_DN117108_c0_g1~~TRINITY_DN117108_c0_g1_i1.p1  ORF type:complete len:213 (-),score=40.36 TRINITY_DN117108_c0_g1_i1:181-819(-)
MSVMCQGETCVVEYPRREAFPERGLSALGNNTPGTLSEANAAVDMTVVISEHLLNGSISLKESREKALCLPVTQHHQDQSTWCDASTASTSRRPSEETDVSQNSKSPGSHCFCPPLRRRERQVRFPSTPRHAETYEITPYTEVYGVHPSCFDFDKSGRMKPGGTASMRMNLDYKKALQRPDSPTPNVWRHGPVALSIEKCADSGDSDWSDAE